jgi:RNA polymerase sigma-70 factor (sigma-E family)
VEDAHVGEREQSAFEDFYRREWPAVFRAAYALSRDRESARELAQEAFARAFERWRSVGAMERPGGWTQRVVVNLAMTWRRRQRLVRERQPRGRAATEGPQETIPVIVAALRALPPEQRAVVVLRYYADLSIDETANALGKPPGTVRSLAAQGLARLRVSMAEQEVRDEPRA